MTINEKIVKAKLVLETESGEVLSFNISTTPKKPKRKIPIEIYELRGMTRPMFSMLLSTGKWKEDKTLTGWYSAGIVKIIEGRGFLITEKGKELVRSYGLDM